MNKTNPLSRYLCLALALVMLLPLIVIPTSADSEETNILWSEDFEAATSIGDVFRSWGMNESLTITSSATDSANRVVQMSYTPMAPEAYYISTNKDDRYPIKNANVEGNVLTGTVTVGSADYTVVGEVNAETWSTALTSVTAVADGSDVTSTYASYYVATGALVDAKRGVGNIAVAKYIEHPAWNYADVDDFVLSMDFYIPTGTKGSFAIQLEGKTVSASKSFAIQPFIIKASGSSATLEKNSNQVYSGSGAVSFMLGAWNTVTTIIDRETSEAAIYLNNQYAFKVKNNGSSTSYYNYYPNEPISLSANQMLIQVNRGGNVSAYAGTAQIDNITMAKNTNGLNLGVFSQDFSRATKNTDVLNNAGGHYTYITDSATAPGNKVLQLDAKPYAPAAYYLWKDKNTAGAMTNINVDSNGKVTGDATLGSGSNAVTYNVTGEVGTNGLPKAATVNSCSGTAATVYVVTGDYFDAYNGGGQIGYANYFKHPAWSNADVEDFVIQTDFYMSPGSKGTVAVQIDGDPTAASGQSGKKSVQPYILKADGSKITLQQNSNQNITNGSAATLELGRWYTITLVIDKATAECLIYVDGIYAFTTANKTAINLPLNMRANSFFVQYNRLTSPANLSGFVQVDNIVFRNSIEGLNLKYFSESFSAYASKVGSAANIGTNVNVSATFESDPLNPANTVVKVPLAGKVDHTEILMAMNGNNPAVEKKSVTGSIAYGTNSAFAYAVVTRNAGAVAVSGYTVTENSDGTYNITNGTNTYSNLKLDTLQKYCNYWGGDSVMDQNWALNHPTVYGTTEQKVIFAADYYVSAGAVGSFIGQLKNYQLNGVGKSWLELYKVNCETGQVWIGSQSKTLVRQGEWNHFELTLNLASGDATLVVNGETVGSANFGANLTVTGARWSFCKLLRKQNNYQSIDGYVLADNIEMLTAISSNQVITVEPKNLLYVEVAGKKIYNNTFYITEGTSYNAVYLNPSDYSGMLTTETKNSVRLSSAAGLRFATRVDTDLLNELYALLDAGDVEKVEFGHLIAPVDYLTGELSVERLSAEGKKYLKVAGTRDAYYDFDNDAATTHFVGSIVDLYEKNVARNFAARGYVSVTLKTGGTVMLYSGVTHADNVQAVATDALASGGSYTAAQKTILETFKAGNVPPLSEAGQMIRDLKGLNVLAIGDSLFDGDDVASENTWLALVAKNYNWNLTNLGRDGWTVASTAFSNVSGNRGSIYDALITGGNLQTTVDGVKYGFDYTTWQEYCFGTTNVSANRFYNYGNPGAVADADVDLILLEGGTNDYGYNSGIALGDLDSTDPKTVYGAWNGIIQKLHEMYPNAKLVFVTAWHQYGNPTRMEYNVNALKRLAIKWNAVEGYDVACIDAGDPTLSGINMMDSTFRAQYSVDTYSEANHLNEAGMQIMAESMKSLIWKTVFSDAVSPEVPTEITRVACVGDSITAGGYWKTNLMGRLNDEYEVLGFGVSGSTGLKTGIDSGFAPDGSPYGYVTHDAYTQSLAANPDIVVIMLGTNDTKPVNSDRIYADGGAQFKADMIAMVESYQALATDPKIYIALPCTIYRDRNSGSGINDGDLVDLIIPLLLEVAEATGSSVIDVHTATQNSSAHFSDGVHPSDDTGRGLIATAVADAILADRA